MILEEILWRHVGNITQVSLATLPASSIGLFALESITWTILTQHDSAGVVLFARGYNSSFSILPADFCLTSLVLRTLLNVSRLQTSSWIGGILTFKTSIAVFTAWGNFHIFGDIVNETRPGSFAKIVIFV